MATKNLARSVIEGGRYFFNHFERDQSHRVERADVRHYLYAVRSDPELADRAAGPVRQHVGRTFRDKLSPAFRFLDSRVGKSWNTTRSMIAARFDTRTTAGRHIVFDHVLREVSDDQRYARYFVDRCGILRRHPPRTFQRALVFGIPPLAWLGNRTIGRVGMLRWFVPTCEGVVATWDGRRLVHTAPGVPRVSFRQSTPLDALESARFDSLSPVIQKAILASAPVRSSG